MVPYGEVPRGAASHRMAPYGALPRDTNAFMSLPYNPKLRIRARELRKSGNLSEVLLWLKLKGGQINGWDFDRQKIIGNYIVDFYCGNAGLTVEIDGDSHIGKEEYDAERDAYLMGLGLSVLHISDNDIKKNREGVIATIKYHHGTTPPKHHPAASGCTPPKEGNK